MASCATIAAVASPATAAPTSESARSESIHGQLPSGSILMNSPEYDLIASSPGFHFAAANAGGPEANAASFRRHAMTLAPATVASTCNYSGKADYPHVSSGEASVHGYWIKNSGRCPSTATVTVDLQARACSDVFGCVWITQSTASGTFTPGPGTGKWATPHKKCANSSTGGWRGRVDVDLTDWSDPSGYDYSVAVDLACSPA